MARGKSVSGKCHICGVEGKLTFEHVPPRSAFNDRPLLAADIEELLRTDSDLDASTGKIEQRGAGSYTLCARCNNDTGKWYGNAFADWTYQGMRVINLTRSSPSLYYQFSIFPLRVLKQVICMFLSINHSGFSNLHPGLVKLVLNRTSRYLPNNIRIYAYYNTGIRIRQTAGSAMLNFHNHTHNLFSEVTFPPFGYVMSIDSAPLNNQLVDVSYFSRYRYDDWKDLALRLPVFPIHSWLPGDYRSREQIEKTRQNQDPEESK